jgi:single-stranded-DNA-specific exonuclease
MQKILNLEKASERIKKAVAGNERIILYGDSDLDGISSVVILEEAIKSLGGKVDCAFFPDREKDGYGINLKALEMLKDKSPALFITLDLGISNIKEVDLANKMGFEVIIIDHHETLVGTPAASIIVDPKQESDDYYFKGLANVGITYNLCLEILGENISQSLKTSFLELTALGTIADMVPQIEQNEKIIEEGLRSLKNTFRPALRAFFDILGFDAPILKIISSLNAAESVNFENESYKLLTSSDLAECKELVQKLINKNQDKQEQIKNIILEVERRILQKPEQEIIFEGDPAWRLTLAGAVASILCNKYQKPTFIFKKGDTESCGSVRNPKGTNSVEAMKTCADFLLTYGGHAQASGFRLKNENLEKFKNYLNDFFGNDIDRE